MELGGLFKEFTEVFSGLKNSVNDIYAKIKLLSTSLVETNSKIDNIFEQDKKELSAIRDNINNNNKLVGKDVVEIKDVVNNNNKSTLAEIEDIKEKSNNLNKIVLKELSDIKKEYNLHFSAKEEEIKLLKNDIKELKQSIVKNNNEFILYKTTTDSYIKDIEKLLSNNVDEKIKSLMIKNSEFLNNLNSIKSNISSIEEQINFSLKQSKTNSQDIINFKSQVTENINSIKELITSTTIRKKDLLKSLQEDGNIDLLYNLKLTPRVLPKTVMNGLLIIDAKDGKLKYGYNDKWKIV